MTRSVSLPLSPFCRTQTLRISWEAAPSTPRAMHMPGTEAPTVLWTRATRLPPDCKNRSTGQHLNTNPSACLDPPTTLYQIDHKGSIRGYWGGSWCHEPRSESNGLQCRAKINESAFVTGGFRRENEFNYTTAILNRLNCHSPRFCRTLSLQSSRTYVFKGTLQKRVLVR